MYISAAQFLAAGAFPIPDAEDKQLALANKKRVEMHCKEPKHCVVAYPEQSALEKLQILTVKLMEVLHLWQPRDHVVEMSL